METEETFLKLQPSEMKISVMERKYSKVKKFELFFF